MASWQKLRDEAAQCTRCDLYRRATQTVFGEGRTGVSITLVGEQPGDQEDKQGHPFVGPAGRILDRALDEAGIDRDDVYVTNAVKHFKWWQGLVVGTIHPSAVLRGPDPEDSEGRERAYAGLVADLAAAREAAAEAAR